MSYLFPLTMEFVDLQTGQIRTASEMQTSIEVAAKKMQALDDEQCRKVGVYIFNRAPGLALYMNEIAKQFDVLATRHGTERQLSGGWWTTSERGGGRGLDQRMKNS